MEAKKNTVEKICEMQTALDILGGKWTFLIIYALLDGKKRFKELERAVTGINTRMLVKELKNLEDHQILTRTAFATVPPTVEYSLTDKGRDLEATMKYLYKWTKDWM
ncbi:winged helix-turn-helix transcriptional regulator [Chitinophaga arvensicola]|uniref:DNA-binding transcriptional regulator, HxlR family n=1 Tax=Chitinophaga arvensicola TaxID=29529 RepID=A0A1I0RU74_9BACT|nr:helix-turn-helix domain-containing protein [Chitinophaga arvensicola]SEW44837.1 DNA-binding transcriptional regulator, HxlR family [Chitinophaga arvensicola]